jgi:hypothetical protein
MRIYWGLMRAENDLEGDAGVERIDQKARLGS